MISSRMKAVQNNLALCLHDLLPLLLPLLSNEQLCLGQGHSGSMAFTGAALKVQVLQFCL